VSYSKYSGVASLLILSPLVLTTQRAQENVVPLQNWATPLYWQPNQAERVSTAKAQPQLQFSANAVSTTALTLVAITPCRLVDTRGGAFNGISPFSGPSIPAMGSITIHVGIGARVAAVGVIALHRFLFVGGCFRGCKERLIREIRGPLQRREGDVGPVAGEIRLAVRGPGRSPDRRLTRCWSLPQHTYRE